MSLLERARSYFTQKPSLKTVDSGRAAGGSVALDSATTRISICMTGRSGSCRRQFGRFHDGCVVTYCTLLPGATARVTVLAVY